MNCGISLERALELKKAEAITIKVPVATPLDCLLEAKDEAMVPSYFTVDLSIPIVNIVEFRKMCDCIIMNELGILEDVKRE